MIKHGKVYKIKESTVGCAQLDAIKSAITKGVADAKEQVILQPKVCDIKGAKTKDAQNCVIARTLTRTMHLKAVSVGRSLAYLVGNDGIAVRFHLPHASREMVEEFDQRGKASTAPIRLNPPHKSWIIGAKKQLMDTRTYKDRKNNKNKPNRTRKYGVRIVRAAT